MPYVDSVYAWRRASASASAVVGEARAWLPSYGDAELATGDNGHQTADTASNGTTNWWTLHKTIWCFYYTQYSFTEELASDFSFNANLACCF